MLRCRLPSLPRHLHIIKSGDMLVLLLTLTIAVFFIDGFQLVNLNDSNPADAELRPFKLWNPLTLWIAEKGELLRSLGVAGHSVCMFFPVRATPHTNFASIDRVSPT